MKRLQVKEKIQNNHTKQNIFFSAEKDHLTSKDTITEFAEKHRATLTVIENGEHWFHTDEQMTALDNWIKNVIE